MFTGIIGQKMPVTKVDLDKNGMRLEIKKPPGWKLKLGDSINLNGVCSTVMEIKTSYIAFQYMPETLVRSNLRHTVKSETVNLERSLLASAHLDGHIVQGHIDIVGEIISLAAEGNSYVFSIKVPDSKLIRLIAEKGAVAVDGISLTVAAVFKNYFTVKIIPYTLAHTNLGYKKVGDTVNLEFDVLAKYLQRLITKD